MKACSLLLMFSLVLLSCNKQVDKRVCEYQSDDPVLQVYNDLLIELVENHFYDLYLGEEQEAIQKEWYKIENPDSISFARFEEKLIKLHNKRFGKSASFMSLYLAHSVGFASRFDEEFFSDSSSVRLFLRKYNANNESTIRRLGNSQRNYKADAFLACTFKIDSLGEAKSFLELHAKKKRQAFGQIAFSEIEWTDTEEGLLYYEFICGGKCGKGEVLSFKKVNGRWIINGKVQLWVS